MENLERDNRSRYRINLNEEDHIMQMIYKNKQHKIMGGK